MALNVEKVHMCRFYAEIYADAPSISMVTSLDSALPELHAAVIVFSVKTQEYFRARCKLDFILYFQQYNIITIPTYNRGSKSYKCVEAI